MRSSLAMMVVASGWMSGFGGAHLALGEEATLDGAAADQFIAAIETALDKSAEHPVDGGIEVRLSRVDCARTIASGEFSCDVLYSDRMSEDGRHYRTESLDPAPAAEVYQSLKDLFGVRVRGPEAVTGAQDIVCSKPADGRATSCALSRLEQPRG